jgi:hypothetical protein
MSKRIENLKGEQWERYANNYYFSNYGRVKRIGKTKEWLINPYTKTNTKGHKALYVHIHAKEIRVSNVIYRLFIGSIPEGYRVHHKDNVYTNNDYMNLELLSMKELGQVTGYRSRRRLIYDIDNKCFYKGTREAAAKLYVSRQTISDYCNGKVKKPMLNLRWAYSWE